MIISALVLDMDGLMLDSEVAERRAWLRSAAEHGCTLSAAEFLLLVGRDATAVRQILTDLWHHRGEPADRYEAVLLRKIELVAEDTILPKPGLTELLGWARSCGLPVAVASSSARQVVLDRLAAVDVLHLVDAIVGGDEVTRGKPEPDIFLEAAHRLGTLPRHCAVVEDSDSGIRAAAAAGMVPILVPDSSVPRPIPAEILTLAAHQCGSLFDVTACLIEVAGRP